MTMNCRKIWITSCFVVAAGISAGAQTAPATPSKTQSKVSAKEPIAPASNSTDPELDHIAALISQLKLEIAAITDPAAKKAAMTNLALWKHLFDRLCEQNTKANNVVKPHHHSTAPADPALKQAPKPPA